MAIGQSSRAKLVIARFGTVEVSAFKITYYNILLSEILIWRIIYASLM